jgi:hypothetical protein
MARGWESKSVEAQIDMAEARKSSAAPESSPDPRILETLRRKEHVLLSRTRVLRELANVESPRYKAVLEKALADLDAQLATLG